MTDPIAHSLIQRLADAREAEQEFGPMPDARDSLLEEARAYLLQPVDLSHMSGDEHNALERGGIRTPVPIPLSERLQELEGGND